MNIQDARREATLSWLAMYVGSWPEQGQAAGIGDYLITKEEWEKKRKRLINEPDNINAPKWARYKAQDKRGMWRWYETVPYWQEGEWFNPSRAALACQGKVPAGHNCQDTAVRIILQHSEPKAGDMEDQSSQGEKQKALGPDDSTTPEWAKWKTQGQDGEWFWYVSNPEQVGIFWDAAGLFEKAAQRGVKTGHDRLETLQRVRRPGEDSAPTVESDPEDRFEQKQTLGPDNRAAPDWANWKAQDRDGQWYWYASKPKRTAHYWGAVGPFKYAEKWTRSAGDDWRDTLQPVCRPGGDPAPAAEKKKGTPRIDIIGQNGNDGDHYSETADGEAVPSSFDTLQNKELVKPGYEALDAALVDTLKHAQRNYNGVVFKDTTMQEFLMVFGPDSMVHHIKRKLDEAHDMAEGGDKKAAERAFLNVSLCAATLLVWVRGGNGANEEKSS